MDMQPNLQFIIHNPYSKPIIKNVEMSSSNEFIFSGVELSEYSRVEVKLQTPLSLDAVLRIESCETEELLELKSNSGKITIMHGNSQQMLVPGEYPFEVIVGKEKYQGYYVIKSNHFSDQPLINLRKYLEKLLRGLSSELIKHHLGVSQPSTGTNYTLMNLLQFIDKHKNQIQNSIQLISRDPITDLISQHSLRNYSRKPDSKSFRWQARKSALNNTHSFEKPLHYEKHTLLTTYNIENQWISYIISYFIRCLFQLEKSFRENVQSIENQIIEKRKSIEDTEISLGKIKQNSIGYREQGKRLNQIVYRLNKRIEELEKEKEEHNKYVQLVKRISNLFNEIKKMEWLNGVPTRKPKMSTNRLLKDYRYRNLYNLYRDLSQLEISKPHFNQEAMRHRKTWQLFEYYNLGLLIDILRDNNYEWISGWLADKENPFEHIGTLPGGTVLIFKKPDSDHYIEVAYDQELESTLFDKSYSRYFNYEGRRPDIRMTIYRQDGSLYGKNSGLVIESKCRHHRYLINNDIDPDVKIQLGAFKNLNYYNSKERGVETPIKQVIVLYPKQKGIAAEEHDSVYGEGIIYLQIEPVDPESEETPFGYESFKKWIEEFLSPVLESEEIVK
ncbi:hypothetical protein [Priestia megaterium]|uniref:hypothetical protein n=1 Tax=Priestia megaterium TaxID=1404 RepID=UPI002A6A5EF4|nr:hypothetical protein [Priestia megaterium]MDY0943636.1 hypothetical protein [Priestia megaterium]